VLSTPPQHVPRPPISREDSTQPFFGWAHPNMPSAGTILWVIEARPPATPAAAVLIGDAVDRPLHDPPATASPTDGGVSLLQPEFTSDSSLHLISDHRGHWALYSLDFTPGAARPLTTDAHHAPPTTRLGLEMLHGVLDTGRETASWTGHEAGSHTGRDAESSAARDTGGEIGGALWQLGAKWHLHDGDEVWAHAQSATATLVRCRSGEDTWDALA